MCYCMYKTFVNIINVILINKNILQKNLFEKMKIKGKRGRERANLKAQCLNHDVVG